MCTTTALSQVGDRDRSLERYIGNEPALHAGQGLLFNHSARRMQVHLFRGPGRIFGATAQASGENLPQKYAPWVPFKTIELRYGEQMPGIDAKECLDDLQAHGVHVTDAHRRITEEALR